MWTSAKRTDSCREERPRACVLQPLGILLPFFWLIGAVLGNGPTALAHEVAVDFDNVDLRVFIKFVSEATGRVFLVDDRVRGQVSVRFTNKIPVEQLYTVLESVLEVKGFAAVPAGAITKIVPLGTARQRGIEVQGRGSRSVGER
jgi:type II secretory pathway component GspD/PulD (secretin)